jgi:hypothetical protein
MNAELDVHLDRVFMRINVFIILTMMCLMRQMDSESARTVRRKLRHDGGAEVYTTGENGEDGRDSNDSRASTPCRTEHVWVALYSVEHEIERGRLLHQVQQELEGSNLLTFASLLMFDFMESARFQNSEELNFWREEIRLSLIQQSALPPEEMRTRRDERMTDMLNSFVETRGVDHRILSCSVPPFFERLPESDKRGCVHVVFSCQEPTERRDTEHVGEGRFMDVSSKQSPRVLATSQPAPAEQVCYAAAGMGAQRLLIGALHSCIAHLGASRKVLSLLALMVQKYKY